MKTIPIISAAAWSDKGVAVATTPFFLGPKTGQKQVRPPQSIKLISVIISMGPNGAGGAGDMGPVPGQLDGGKKIRYRFIIVFLNILNR